MNEFLKIKWRVSHPSELESMFTFLDDNSISNSYIYKNFQKPIKLPQKKSLKLTSTSEPYVPGRNHFKKIRKRSLLTKPEKNHCLKALKLIQSAKCQTVMTQAEKHALKVYNECQSKIVQENARFLDFTKMMWMKKIQNHPKIQVGLYKYAHNHWLDKIKKIKDYPQFYQQHSLISLNYIENNDIITFNCIENVAEMGSLARFSPPNLHEICQLKIASLPQLIVEKNSQLPVSFDENIVKIIENNQIDIVISSSGIQQIIDNTDLNAKWCLPVIVKEMNCCNSKRKIVFIDKVLPKFNPNYYNFKKFAYKQLLRSNFCQYEAFKFPNEDISIESCDNKEEVDGNGENLEGKKSRKIHHNASYRIWNIKRTSESNNLMKNKTKDCDINVLVRTKLDCCQMTDQGVLSPIILEPKIEQQIEFGANIASKSELIRCWSRLFFHPFSNLYRVRLVAMNSEVISVEKCPIQKITTEAFANYELKTNLSLGILQRILQELSELETGNYILQHLPKHESFVAIMKECIEGDCNNYDLYADYEDCKIDQKKHPDWLPIDVNYILPSHEAYNMIPAVFDGFDGQTNTTKRIRKRKKQRKKNKKKLGDAKQDDKTL